MEVTGMRTPALVLIATAIVFGATTMARQAGQPEVALQAAIRTETIDGDLRKAIQQYEAVARGGDRGAAARALLRMADCYQKLGDAQARSTYERLVRDFAEQTQAVATARVRLNASGAGSAAVVARQLWTTTAYSEVTITNDGRSAAIVESGAPDFRIRDFDTGRTASLSLRTDPTSDAYMEWPVLSPDRKSVAYAWAGPETNWGYQVRVSALQPGAKPKPLGSVYPYVYVRAWARDGKSVLVDLLGAGTAQIAWISIVDGTVRPLRTGGWESFGLPALSPDGTFIAYDRLIEPGRPEREIRIIASDGTSDSVVVRAPGINASPVWSRDGTRLVFKSNRSGTFGIWSIPVRHGQSDGPTTLLKADVGDGELIGFTAAGSLLFEQRTGTRDLYAMDLDPQQGTVRGTRTRLVDTFVGSNLNPSASPDGKSLAYVSQRTQGLTVNGGQLVIRSLETGEERVMPTIFRGAGKPLWLPDGHGLIVLARNHQNHTTIYRVDLTSSEIVTLLDTGQPAPQLAALSPDGRTVYFGTKGQGEPLRNHVVVFDLASGRRTDVSHAGTSWGMAASPDGRSIAFVATETITPPFRADLYVADADGVNVRTVLTANTPGDFPADLAWSSDSRFIYFLRRGKGSLWRVAATGGSPTLVGELSPDVVGTIDISPDGRRVIYGAGGPPTIEVWALENLRPQSAVR
jgi:Tol biopolymer transport system component